MRRRRASFHHKKNSLSAVFLMVPVAGVEPARYRYHWILSSTGISEVHAIKRNLAEPTDSKNPAESTTFTCFVPKSSIPQGFSEFTILTLKKEIGGPSEGHL